DVGYWVVWEAGQAALSPGENILGRDRDVAVWLDSPTVSRHHARILISGDQVILEDLASKNGTHMRGERIAKPHPLTDGDRFDVGSVAVTFRISRAASTQTQTSRKT